MDKKIDQITSYSKKMYVSEYTLAQFREIKKNLRFKTDNELVLYLISEKKAEVEEYIRIAEREKTLAEIEKHIYARIESVQKRLSKYATLYFDKIIDGYNLQERSVVEILKAINNSESGEQKAAPPVNDQALKKLENEKAELLDELLQSNQTIQDLEKKIKGIKARFELKSGAFSKSFEARLNRDDFEKIFED
ncbi:hypothetical protein J8J42_02545 [Chryseobacterium sp. cx-311]|uniref:hypothetical protein n=1 Tax=Marnyiella aurantia TaxID=2758037 RepID=UPI001AEA6EB7|nr:hypothetical protein [Marnyiella aurantia]MBP0611923.1 hypothetical protein [Marnyiella aurantia]